MAVLEMLGSIFALVLAVAIGMVVHEASHAVVLEAFGVPYDIQWVAGSEGPGLNGGLFGAWATVTPLGLPEGTPIWSLQLSALAPLALLAPFALVVFGVVPDPLSTGNAVTAALTIGWLACALPSPQDFSLVWHPELAVEALGETKHEMA